MDKQKIIDWLYDMSDSGELLIEVIPGKGENSIDVGIDNIYHEDGKIIIQTKTLK